jgi:intracellular multiplication protein IcmP
MSGGGNQSEPTVILFLAIALLIGFGWLLWWMSREFWLDYFFRWLRFGEIWMISTLTGKYAACVDWLHYAPVIKSGVPITATPAINQLTVACFGPHYLQSLPKEELPYYYSLSMPPLRALGSLFISYIRWPATIILAVLAFYEMMFSPRTKFLTKHNLESFIEVQAKMWPVITPITKFNPSKSGRVLGSKVPDKLPLFAEALSPEEWISWHRIPMVNGVAADGASARRAFVQQLGPRWVGIDTQPIHIKALFAAFSLKGAQKRDESDKFLGELAKAWSPDKGFKPSGELIKEIERIIADSNLGGQTKDIAARHAYRTTALLGALKWARSMGGVLAPAQFLWLRGEDRALWYPLNNMGRRPFHTEGAGALAHFMAEEAAKKPLPIPRVETAIATLNHYLQDPGKRSVPIPPREGDPAKA